MRSVNMSKQNHMVEKDFTLQFYKGENRMRVDIEGMDIFILRDRDGNGVLLRGQDEIEDAITLLTKIKDTKLANK